ncbi:hypothetical protein AUJ10_00770 [Candidatus Pacearchaeota archaeon CG1_02_31_27]|nr:MAG: hypothetical protein AUJ10_00770 [Candidatus Pacearchaeota archaeon CG1_02_31_27]PIN92347.1 MAG: hypothetical protein COU55_00880 [Candidatus Pacearchaeota archaeon CG10_big_fil_rev_8_21_14_0_10_31_59]PIZ80760.1 MAG: hypothetical protein COX99_01750 [Candidatus Pacearchaeota archaeon CG_4_10_14_0_2_um_filter_31_10]
MSEKNFTIPAQLCVRCRGKGLCGMPCPILKKFRESQPKIKEEFSGSSPPEIFVGRYNYPNIFAGILAPNQNENTENMSFPESWLKENKAILDILNYRSKLIYSRFQTKIKGQRNNLDETMQITSMASSPFSLYFKLKKKPNISFFLDIFHPIIGNPALVEKIKPEENVKVESKVDYLINDVDVKATTAMNELYKSRINTSNIIKILSAGLLGIKKDRKLVPTRWAITATDDSLGKQLLEKIRYYQEISEIQLFHYYYNGNHFEVLFLPGNWSFEVIEVSMPGSEWNATHNLNAPLFMQDYESSFPRKKYAENVVGAYYTDRLAACEYLEKIKRQATVLLLHEERPEYFAPLGVGIIRESLRKMFFETKPEKPETIEEAFFIMEKRLHAPISKYKEMSWILKNYGKQKKLFDFN